MEGLCHKGKCVAVMLGEGWHGPGGGWGLYLKQAQHATSVRRWDPPTEVGKRIQEKTGGMSIQCSEHRKCKS